MTGMPDLLTTLSVLNVGARTHEDILTGPAMPMPHGRSFGGQVLGQAIAAAGTTLPEGREIHSMHAYFLRPGNSEEQMTFEISRLHDGRSFSTRRAQAFQGGRPMMAMIASFQDQDTGLDHHDTVDISALPGPDDLPSVWEKYGHLSSSGEASWILNRPFDFRYLESDIVLNVSERTNRQRVWMRSRDAFDQPQLLQSAALAFASDYLILEPIVRKHGIPWATPGMKIASLDHAMWFHRPFRIDDWLLFEISSPTAQSGRGLAEGRFYDRDGRLVSSVTQEGMVRTPSDED